MTPGTCNSCYTRLYAINAVKHKSITFSDFQVERKLGEGGQGVVHLARHRISGYRFALKVIELKGKKEVSVYSEVDIHSQLIHPNIIRLYAAWVEDGKLYMVMEYASKGDIAREIELEDTDGLSEARAAEVVQQIASALEYMHSKDIIHRDVKIENMLVTGNSRVKLGDFGLSRRPEAGQTVFRGYGGTDGYKSPETELGYCDGRSDVYSLGISCYAMIWNGTPRIAKGTVQFDEDVKEFFSDESREFITGLTKKQPARRTALEDLESTDFFEMHSPGSNNGWTDYHDGYKVFRDFDFSRVLEDIKAFYNTEQQVTEA
jgi:serine/threonine protein kinase